MGCCSKLLNNPRTEKEAMESSLCYCFWMNHNAVGSSIGGIVLQKLIYCPVSYWFSVLFSAIHSDEIQRNKTIFNDIGQLCIHTDEYVSNPRALFTWSDPCTERHISWVSPIGLSRALQTPSIGGVLIGWVPCWPAMQWNAVLCGVATPRHHTSSHHHDDEKNPWTNRITVVDPALCPVCRTAVSSGGSEFPGNPRMTSRNQMQVSQQLFVGQSKDKRIEVNRKHWLSCFFPMTANGPSSVEG